MLQTQQTPPPLPCAVCAGGGGGLDIGFQVSALSLTSVSTVIGSRQELDSDRYACTGASKEP